MTTSFPRQQARTRRFTLGVPRAFTPGVAPDGPLVLFLRTDAGDDPVTHLWRHDPATGETRKLVDARALGGDDEALPPEERARRERAREQAGGIVGYATDAGLTCAAFTLAGRLYTVDLGTGEVVEHPTAGPAFDPRPAPDGSAVAYHAAGGLHVLDLTGGPSRSGRTRPLLVEDGVVWGRAEFVAAEEMGRSRGAWWSGDGRMLAVARVDESPSPVWYLGDPAAPWQPPTEHHYPAAGCANADVSLWVVEVATGERRRVALAADDAYLAHVTWGDDPLTVLVQSRDQRRATVGTVDPATGTSTEVRSWTDPAWVELVPGTPTWLGDRLVTVEDRTELGAGGTRVLCLDGAPVTPAGLQVREVLAARADIAEVTFLASPPDDPTAVTPWQVGLDPSSAPVVTPLDERAGLVRLVPGGPAGTEHGEVGSGGPDVPRVLVAATLERAAPTVTVGWVSSDGEVVERHLDVVAETPVLRARPRMLRLGARALRAALFLPDDGGSDPLPVLLDPYGGPHAQRVVAAEAAHLTSQWLADQGFAVLVVDGRGSPGRGPEWERAIHRDLASAPLDDQIDALRSAVQAEPRLDLERVAIRGWSFGGYLAALAVLRRPDVFHAAIAGAPVTDWRLYDTHYTERYLGHPDHASAAYEVSSLVDADGQLLGAEVWDEHVPPALLVVHGLADDNVVAAHALRLSSALLADGRPHRFLPLSGVTHMTPQEVVAEQLLVQQVRFLREAFALRAAARHTGAPGGVG